MVGSVTAVIALAIAAVLMWKNRASKIVALLALVAGAGITAGLLGQLLRDGLRWASDMVGRLTSTAVGVAVPSVLAIVFVLIYVHDMWPRHRASRVTAFIGLALPVLAVALPGAAGGAVTTVIASTGEGLSRVVAAMFGGA